MFKKLAKLRRRYNNLTGGERERLRKRKVADFFIFLAFEAIAYVLARITIAITAYFAQPKESVVFVNGFPIHLIPTFVFFVATGTVAIMGFIILFYGRGRNR